MEGGHVSVLVKEVLNFLKCESSKVYVDCTIGDGGHSYAILKKSTPNGLVIGIDQDMEAIEYAKKRLSCLKERIVFIHDNFCNIKKILKRINILKVDGILFDLGVSSRQLDSTERGFSFSHDAPLDMRMDRSKGISAADLVNELPFEDLYIIFKRYGEEKWSYRIAKAIVREREVHPIRSTSQLADIVTSTIPISYRSRRIHPATKTFQALRIAVNKELTALEEALRDAIDLLNQGSRICVISFHSLEDRIVKDMFRVMERGCSCPSEIPICMCRGERKVRVLTKGPVIPSKEEISINPRSRSAKLRVAERL
ncbi:MAG: 16S rRNA (cytosine(1402)-N(4))-methyltransferase RsmH [Nitrospinae bacterium]|nr:16S rRNA (cytosine(1402)-N(4))-methyltransferase RsmH [Nitrospinota bacterium]